MTAFNECANARAITTNILGKMRGASKDVHDFYYKVDLTQHALCRHDLVRIVQEIRAQNPQWQCHAEEKQMRFFGSNPCNKYIVFCERLPMARRKTDAELAIHDASILDSSVPSNLDWISVFLLCFFAFLLLLAFALCIYCVSSSLPFLLKFFLLGSIILTFWMMPLTIGGSLFSFSYTHLYEPRFNDAATAAWAKRVLDEQLKAV